MAELFASATEYLANEITFTRGTSADIVSVGVYHTLNPNEVPTEAQFQTVTLVDDPLDPLAEGTKIDVVSLIGPNSTSPAIVLTAGDWQRWVMIKTANETIIRKVDIVTVTDTTP